MNRVERGVKKRRFPGLLLSDSPAGFLGQQVRGVPLVVARLVITMPVQLPAADR
jgi:hypothetical protein